jgi:hypothetical protein
MEDGVIDERRTEVEFFNYDDDDEKYDRILAEAEPCPDCGDTGGLALVAVTEEEMFGYLLIICLDCHTEEDFPVEQERERVYA